MCACYDVGFVMFYKYFRRVAMQLPFSMQLESFQKGSSECGEIVVIPLTRTSSLFCSRCYVNYQGVALISDPDFSYQPDTAAIASPISTFIMFELRANSDTLFRFQNSYRLRERCLHTAHQSIKAGAILSRMLETLLQDDINISVLPDNV